MNLFSASLAKCRNIKNRTLESFVNMHVWYIGNAEVCIKRKKYYLENFIWEFQIIFNSGYSKNAIITLPLNIKHNNLKHILYYFQTEDHTRHPSDPIIPIFSYIFGLPYFFLYFPDLAL